VKPLPRLRHARELLDDPAVDARALEASLDDVAAVNRWLGGTRAVRLALDELAGGALEISVLDVGCGHADVPLALQRRAQRARRSLRIVGVDLHPATARVARRRTHGHGIAIGRADAVALPFADRSFDIALLSLTLHHLDDAGQRAALRELARVARVGVIVNELRRSRANLAGARLLAATVWRDRAITRHDGPISVLRAFTPGELRALGREAGLRNVRVRCRFFQRVLLIGESAR
jgi:SAM-dependent methyltransferase